MFCDECGKVVTRLTNCYCRRVICDACRPKHWEHLIGGSDEHQE